MTDKSTKDIPEEKIRSKAYEIWKERKGKDISPEGDWYAAKKILEEKFWRKFWSFFTDSSSRDFALEVIKTLGIGLTAVGFILTFWNAKEDRKLVEERLVTERFSKAVEQLEKEKETVRIGGIYALERIAKDSDKDHWTIMEVLTSYIRENSPFPEQEETQPIDIDVQAALTVIGRRNRHVTQKHLEELEEGKTINLTNSNLIKANLGETDFTEVNLTNANLTESNLTNANFTKANLTNADLTDAEIIDAELKGIELYKANLTRAKLSNTNLTGAILTEANFTKANLLNTNLTGAHLIKADLTEANFSQTDLTNADLFCANLSQAKNLKIGQIKLAKSWKKAIYDDEFREQLGLPLVSQFNNCPK